MARSGWKICEREKQSQNRYFKFIFPQRFLFNTFNTILNQLSDFLRDIDCPYESDVSIDEFYKKIFKIGCDKDVIFDLTRTDYIGDLEILMLHVLGEFCYKVTGEKIIFKIGNTRAREILAIWNFFEHFEEWGKLDSELRNLNLFSSTKNIESILPIRKISNNNDVGSTIDRMAKKKVKNMLEKNWGMDEDLIKIFSTKVISEICDNIPRHSKSNGYIMVHAHPPQIETKDPNLEIAISDGGIGIKQSLYNRYPQHYGQKSNFETIKEVLEGNFQRPQDEEHGGILRARTFVDKFGGTIYIRSICAKSGNFDYPKEIDQNWKFFPGTHVNIMIPQIRTQNKTHKI